MIMTRQWVALCFASLAGVVAGCNVPRPDATVDDDRPSERLVLSVRSPDRVVGTFTRGETKLEFEGQLRGNLDTKTGMQAHLLVLRRADQTPLLRMSSDGKDVRFSVLDTLQTRAPTGSAQPEQVTQAGDPSAFAQLVGTPEFSLLPPLSDALLRAGLDGTAYPAVEAVHELGAHARRMLDAAAKRETTEKASSLTRRPGGGAPCRAEQCLPEWYWDEETCSCQPVDDPNPETGPACDARQYRDLRSDPCGNSCEGMCGPGCTCWPWVCGDCGFYAGCDLHDSMCGLCYKSKGLAVPACTICWTPLAAVVANVGCGF